MTIRVFISSTFRDMHAERDYLSRLVFPELRSRCQKRGAEFIGLDLSWGVTEEEAQREGALKICLDEIERCRPFFVCLLGSRYGWVPPLEEVPPKDFEDAARGTPPIALDEWYALDETNVPPVYRLRRDRPIPGDVADTLARFWEKAGLPTAGESITAREILRGVFEEGFPATHVMFYLRKPGIEAAPAFPPTFVPVFVEPDANRRTKLHDLETKIRKCKDPMVVRDYGAAFAGLRIDPNLLPDDLSDEERTGIKDGAVAADQLDGFSARVRQVILERGTVALSGLETLGDQILEDLWTAIEKELERPGEVLDRHQRERAYHERFVIDRTRLFLGRDEIVKRILDGLTDPAGGNLLVVSGAPGSGKSALLAECARRARERFQDALVIPHFIGASPGSAILANTLRAICETLKRECGLAEEVPADPQKLLQKWPEFLEKAGAKRRVILFLDALNQLDSLDRSHELGWVPYRIPQGVTMVVSALPGDCLDRLRHRVSGEAIIDVPVLAARDRHALVETHLGQRRKKLSPAQLERLLDTTKRPEAGLPLYLRVTIEEVSLFGSYEALDGRIDLLPPTVAGLFDQVLARLDHDHGRDMTASICRWIAVSRSGMLESEILDLLAGPEQVFPRARWSRFYRAIEPYLRPVEEETGEGLLAFYHDQLRFAVFRRYFEMQSTEEPPTDAFREANAELARYFRKAVVDEDGKFPKWSWGQKRSLSELPHHQLGAGMWEALEETLTDIGFVEAKSRTGMVYDLIRDYAAVARAWPGQEEERRKEKEREQRLEEYVTKLTDYARWYGGSRCKRWPKQVARVLLSRLLGVFGRSRRLGPLRGAPPLPTPPIAVAMANEPSEPARQWAPHERVRSWENVVSNHIVALASGEGSAFQVAYNSADSGPVADTLEARLRQGYGSSGPWLHLTNRPAFLLRPGCLKTLEGHVGVRDNLGRGVSAVAITSDGRLAVSGGDDKTLRIWDLETGHHRVLEGHKDWVRALAVTPDGRLAVSGSAKTLYADDTLRMWNLETGHYRVLEGGHQGSVSAVAVTPDGRLAVSGGGNWDLRVWELDTGQYRVLKGHWGSVYAVAMTPDGRRAVSAGEDKTLRLWDLETGHYRVLLRKVMITINAVAVTPEGRRAVFGTGNNTVYVWDLETGHHRVLEGHKDWVRAVAVTADGRRAISGSDDHTVRVWDLETGHSRVLEGHTGSVYAVAMTPDGRRAVSGGFDNTVRVWDLEIGHSRIPEGHKAPVNAVALTSDARHAVSGSAGRENNLRVWDLETGRSRVLEGHTNIVTAVDAMPDGRGAISASYRTGNWGLGGKALLVWDLETGHSRVLEGHWDTVSAIAVMPDGRRAVSGSTDHTLRLWDLETGNSRVLEGHTDGVYAVALTPDGRCAVSGSGSIHLSFRGMDNTLRVWDLETGDTVAIYGCAGGVYSVAQRFPTLVAGTSSGRVYILRLTDTGRGGSLSLLGPRITTAQRLWLSAPGLDGGWADALTAACGACNRRFTAPDPILETIADITCNVRVCPADSTSLGLPPEAWADPGLLCECPLCHEPLKFNPFVVDNRDRYPAP